jgi:NADP-dependent 3-hydroxy acid dehydrogenase YdfG
VFLLIVAKALAANGAKVYILGRRMEALESAAKEIVSAGAFPCQTIS